MTSAAVIKKLTTSHAKSTVRDIETDSASIQATCPKGEQKITVMLRDLDVDYYGGG